MGADYTVKRNEVHYFFNRKNKPLLTIKPGDTVTCDLNDVSNFQITKDTKSRPKGMDRSKFFPLAGPVYVEGAKPGDSLVVDVLKVKATDYGWSSIYPIFCIPYEKDPDYALIGQDLARDYLHVWDLSNGKYASFGKKIKVPIRPFTGTIGVAPEEEGNPDVHSGIDRDGTDMTAFKHGGNMDIRHLTEGSQLILPVYADGALFSCGDPHGAQGDGELDSAIESPCVVTLKFEIEKKTIPNPRFVSSANDASEGPYIGFTGNAPSIEEATIQARSNLIQYLMNDFELSRVDAYMLVGVIADLRVLQSVNGPNWTVGLMVQKKTLGLD